MALMDAAGQGHEAVVEALVQAGAAVDAQDNNGLTALVHAATNGRLTVVQVLAPGAYRKSGQLEDMAFIQAMYNSHMDVIKAMLEAGANPDLALDHTATTVIMWAVGEGRVKMVETLLEAGANPDTRDTTGRTALMWVSGHEAMVPILLGRSNIDLQDYRGVTALMYAATQGHQEVVKLLLEAGVITDMQDTTGRTALMCAEGHVQVVRQLLKAGAELDVQDKEGYTALIQVSDESNR